MNKSFVFVFSLCLSSLLASAQSDSTYQHWLPKMRVWGQQSRVLPVDEQRLAAADSFHYALQQVVAYPESFNRDFADVVNLSIRTSPDEKVRFLTYMIPRKGGYYDHRGFLLLQDDEYRAVELTDRPPSTPLYQSLKPENWYGGLIYEILEKKVDGNTHYVLLGYRSLNPMLHQKYIDVLVIEEGLIRFGAPIFHTPTFNDLTFPRAPYRLTMTYAAKNMAVMQWNEDYGGIVMDHVSPPDASQKGVYMVYGPDFTYDALVWEDEKWHLQTMISFGNEVQTPAIPDSIQTGLPTRPARGGQR